MSHLLSIEFGRIGKPSDWLLIAALAVIMVWAVGLVYRRDASELSRRWRAFLASLRIAVVSLALFVFLDPYLPNVTMARERSRVILLLDGSASMSVADEPSPAGPTNARISRRQRVAEALTRDNFWDAIRKTHDVSVYRFGRDLVEIPVSPPATADNPPSTANQGVEAPLDWNAIVVANDDQTRLGETLSRLIAEKAGPTVAGVVLFGDGRNNAGASAEAAIRLARDAEVPIHAVGVGSDTTAVNLRVTNLQLPSQAFVGDAIKVTAFVQRSGGASRVSVELALESRDAPGKPAVIGRKDVSLPADGAPAAVEFDYLPQQPGHWRIAARTPVVEGEVSRDDNVAAAALEVVSGKTSVLLLAGGPSREYQFLRNLLFRDKTITLSVLLQSTISTPAQDAEKVIATFPANREALFAHDVIVAIDPDWSAFDKPARELLVEWVSSRAGGLIVVAGPIHTPRLARDDSLADVRELYPVVPREVFASDVARATANEPWPIRFTAEGLADEPLLLDDDPVRSKSLWSQFAGFYSAYPITRTRPGCSVLAEFSDPRATIAGVTPPVFATQFHGAGRVFYLGSGELWRLRQLSESLYDRVWIRLIRQHAQGRLLRGGGRQAILLESESYPVGAMIPIRARVLDDRYKPTNIPSVSVSIVDPTGKVSEMALKPELGRPGQYIGLLAARQPGEIRLQLGPTERRIQIVPPRLEFDDTRLDRPLLERLTSQTGGKLITIDHLGDLISLLPDRSRTEPIIGVPDTLWDKPWVMLLLVFLLSTEWLTRKLLLLA